MNQEKIGKLIAKLRKEKGLTQRELGELVGVGYRAVSKWETGLTLPDISIINELSTILGISSDELLKGELNEKPLNYEPPITNNKILNKKKWLLLLIPIILIIIIAGTFLKTKNSTEEEVEYIIQSENPQDYLIEGIININDNRITIKIDKIEFQDYNFYNMMINNYEYKVILNGDFMFGYSNTGEYDNLNKAISIKEYSEDASIYYHDIFRTSCKKTSKNRLTINYTFIDIYGNEIDKSVYAELISNEQ